jgi:predicted DCC family thiol-disulfide oxidoreductase YuxK
MDTNNHGVVLYDGTCLFCHASMRFIVDRDRSAYFRFGAAQDERAWPLLEQHGLREVTASTIVLVEGERVYMKSSAALRIARHLGFPWNLMAAFLIVPAPLRDLVYDAVASVRHRLYGRTDSCEIPSEAIRQRLI